MAKTSPGRLRRSIAVLGLCLLSAVLFRLSFPVPGLFPLAWVALVPWLVVLRTGSRREAIWGSVAMALAAAGLGLSWQYLVTVLGGLGVTIGVALFLLLFAALVRVAHRTLRVPFVLAAAVVWTGCEYLRSFALTGFPWLFLGHTQQPFNLLVQVCDLFGVYAVSFMVMACNALVTEAVVAPRPRPWGRLAAWGAFVAAMVAGALGYGAWRLGTLEYRQGPLVGLVQANIPQDVKNQLTYETFGDIFAKHWKTTLRLRERAEPEPLDLAVWPESMVQWPLNQSGAPFDPQDRAEFAEALERKAAENGVALPPAGGHDLRRLVQWLARHLRCPLLVGAHTELGGNLYASHAGKVDRIAGDRIVLSGIVYELPDATDPVSGWTPEREVVVHEGQVVDAGDVLAQYELRQYNSAYLFDPIGQAGDRYDKFHLVPFGEYVPMKKLLWFLLPAVPYARGFDSSDRLNLMTLPRRRDGAKVGQWRFGVLICFEDAFPRVVRRYVLRPDDEPGADFLVNISNDGWFRGSHELDQHMAICTFRAIEFRTGIVRCCNTGISGIIGPDGRIQTMVQDENGRIKEVRGVAAGRVCLREGLTFYARHGDVFGQACLAFAALAFAIWLWGTIARRFRRKAKSRG